MALFESLRSSFPFTSPRVRGEVGSRSDPGEGDSSRVRLSLSLLMLPLTLTLSPHAGRGEKRL
jgi:hypothetical protein